MIAARSSNTVPFLLVWFAELSSQLSVDQVRRAFEASGASAEEVAGFSARVMEKLKELQSAVAGNS